MTRWMETETMSNCRFPHITDEELVLYALVGDLEAFDELVCRFRRAVTLVAQQVVGSSSMAEDVAQETFLLAFKALPQLKTPAKFGGWLCAIARHRAQRLATREARSITPAPTQWDKLLLTHCPELAHCPATAWERQHERDCVGEALTSLPPEWQLPLQLHYYEEWPVARIAAFLSLPLTTVKWRMHQGRLRLRQMLTEPEENQP